MVSGESFKDEPDLAAEIAGKCKRQLERWPLVVLVDDLAKIHDQTSFLWHVFTRFDPAWDIYADYKVRHNKIQYEGPVIIDARMKPQYPGEVLPREDIAKTVSDRWKEYFPDI